MYSDSIFISEEYLLETFLCIGFDENRHDPMHHVKQNAFHGCSQSSGYCCVSLLCRPWFLESELVCFGGCSFSFACIVFCSLAGLKRSLALVYGPGRSFSRDGHSNHRARSCKCLTQYSPMTLTDEGIEALGLCGASSGLPGWFRAVVI